MTKFVRLYRDAGANPSGGLPPSLADIDDPNYKAPGPITDEPPADPPTPAEPEEGLDEEGNLLEGYERDPEGKVVKVAEPPKDGDDEPVDPTQFWKEVETLTGKPVDVDFGDIDPLSPEGVALRDSALRDSAVADFDEYMRNTYPRAYAYFLHVQNNGADEEFFSTPAPGLVGREAFSQDPDLQSSWLMRDFRSKDVPEDIAQATIDKYIKDGTLQEKALKLYTAQEEADRKRLADLDETNKRNNQLWADNVKQLSDNISKTIKNEMKLLVPEAKQAEFQQSVVDKIQYDGKKFFVVQELGNDLNVVLDSLYLQFMKGDLSTLVEKRAQTKAVHRLGEKVKNDKQRQSGGTPPANNQKYVTLGDI